MVSSLSAFLGEIGRHQLLTPEQELTMGRKVQAMVASQNAAISPEGAGQRVATTMKRKEQLSAERKLRIR